MIKVKLIKEGASLLKKSRAFLSFFIPSCIGIFLFMTPIFFNGQVSIPVAIFSKWLQEALSDLLGPLILGVIMITSIGTLATKVFKPNFIIKNEFLNNLFNVSNVWVIIRMLAIIFTVMTYFEVGPEMVYSPDTGGLVLQELLMILFPIFLFAGLFLPLLLDFGLLEFIGVLLAKFMRPVLKLPGRSAIDCIASWLGDGTISIILTNKQYEGGFYTKREASVISTTFSLVSITFTLVVINTVGLGHMFLQYYFAINVACIAAIFILPKLPPLSRIKDVYIDESPLIVKEEDTKQINYFKHGVSMAIKQAQEKNVFKVIFVDGFKNVIDMWFAVIPSVMGIGTIALIIAEYTPIFKILGLPFVPLLMLLGIPEAVAASQALVAGFADMLLPAIMITGIESELTRFVIAATSVSQLVYLSEVGAVILASKIPLSLKDLFIIFIQRTFITLPIIAIIARLFF